MNQGSVVTALPGTTQGECKEIEGTAEELECTTSEEETYLGELVTGRHGSPGDCIIGGVGRQDLEQDRSRRLREKVWKRDTYNLDDGKLIAEELVSNMTRKDLNRPLPEGVKNIRT
eukprot:94655-Amphidinium_carterae.1